MTAVPRYAALFWRAAQEAPARAAEAGAARFAARGWRRVCDSPGAAIFLAPGADGALAAGGAHRGIVLGWIANAHRAGAPALLSALDAEERGSAPADAFGAYVAFWRSARGTWRAYRDPTGAAPCYFCAQAGVSAFFSDLGAFELATGRSAAIDWRAIALFLAWPERRVRETAIAGVRELFPGERALIGPDDIALERAWSPDRIAADPAPASLDEAAIRLGAAARRGTQAIGARTRRILHRLSGGLDSAIVLGLLREAKDADALIAVNFWRGDGDGDERAFARLAAARAGCRLIEVEASPATSTLAAMTETARGAFSPARAGLSTPGRRALAAIARAEGCDLVTSGQGGDHLFLQRPTFLIAADAVRLYGVSARAATDILGAAREARVPVARAAYAALLHGVLRLPHDPRRAILNALPVPAFLRDPAALAANRAGPLHPWLRAAGSLPPVKRAQIAALLDCHKFQPEPGEPVARMNPLLMQPLIEACLSTPAPLLAPGGADRALARMAFADILPDAIRMRRSKGAIDASLAALFARERAFLRSYLLDGALQAAGIFDRARLETALSEEPSRAADETAALYTALVAETWARRVREAASP